MNNHRWGRTSGWWAGLVLWLLACSLGPGAGTAIPAARPANFEIQTATPTLDPDLATVELEPDSSGSEIVPLGDAPTYTPDPRATPTRPLLPTASPVVTLIETTEVEPTVTPETATPVVETIPANPPTEAIELEPPLEGGDWDFETDFVPWPNPFGEPCPGAAVASGWTAFVDEGEFGSSCMNENLYQPNVFSGIKSQEITFDFISANSGVWRTIPTKPGHRYNIIAHAKHDFSRVSVQMFLGVDLNGGAVWNAETVQWFPWDGEADDTWNATEETITASGERMTIFIRGYHPSAEQGGKTVIDAVSVTHLGP